MITIIKIIIMIVISMGPAFHVKVLGQGSHI